MGNLYLLQCELNLIADGVKTYEDIIDFNHADEHTKSIMAQLWDVYAEPPSQSWYTYQGCWESEDEFAAELASETGFLDSDWSAYFDYDLWTNDLFISDYTSLDCSQCGDFMIVRYN